MKRQIRIDYLPREMKYCMGILGSDGKVTWDSRWFYTMDNAIDAAIKKYGENIEITSSNSW